ncbi:hypothetical protein Tfer_0910 [Thermincola ferriacetica]|uniref:Uncharacterized protein n=2 Tax=Thermincola ferriacetica TaxID=281456 RepID=A0A0L6W491_9FIRM|nr:hypothetical protein Tfer_0910 [Thermincola ferriacetica]
MYLKRHADRQMYRMYKRQEFLEKELAENINSALENISTAMAHLYKLADKYQHAMRDPDFSPYDSAVLPYDVAVSAEQPIAVQIVIWETPPPIWKANPFVRDKVHRALREVWQTTFQEAAEKAVEKLREIYGSEFRPIEKAALIVKTCYPNSVERDHDNYMIKFANNGLRGLVLYDDSYFYEKYIVCCSETHHIQPHIEILVKEITPEVEEFFQQWTSFKHKIEPVNDKSQWY